jgi:hypothetical protein
VRERERERENECPYRFVWLNIEVLADPPALYFTPHVILLPPYICNTE